MDKINSDINKALVNQGISQTAIAKMVDVEQKTVNRLLSGKTKKPDMRVVEKLKTVLGLDTSRPAEAYDIPRSTGRIPIISWAQAGPDGFFEDAFPSGSGFGDINRPYDITDPNAYALIISGDSMIPKYEPGDVILVSPNMGVQTRDYAVVRLKDGTVTAKRIKAKDSRYLLESVNPEYPPIDCSAEDVMFLHRIVWVKQRG